MKSRLFDSTGIAFQDSATVPLEYERAVAAGVGIEKDDFHLTA
jgi:alanine dehydrogenase